MACLIPMKINDGRPRNSIGSLISIAEKYGDGINADGFYTSQHTCGYTNRVTEERKTNPFVLGCKSCDKDLKARKRWITYLEGELGL